MSVTSTLGHKFKLVADGIILDLFKDEEIKLSDNILGLFDLGQLPADFTKTITLPGSKKNNHFFEFVYDISVEDPYTFSTNQKVPCYLDFDGIYLSNGYLQLNKVNVYQNKFIDSYEVTLYGGLASFGRDLKRFFLTDLNVLAKYNHEFSENNIGNSWDGYLFTGSIVYPMVEYGQKLEYTSGDENSGIDSVAGAMCVQDFKPAIKVKDVFDACFEQFGYTYSSSFMQEPMWDDMYMLCNNALRYPVFPTSSYGLTNFNIETYGLYKLAAISGSGCNIVLPLDTAAQLPFYSIQNDPDGFINPDLTFQYAFATNVRGNINLNFQIAPNGAFITGSGKGVPQFSLLAEEYNSGSWTQVSKIPLTNINNYMQEINAYNAGDTKTQTFELSQTFNSTNHINTGSNYNYFETQKLYRWRIYVEPYETGVDHFLVTLDPGTNPKSYLEITKTNQAGELLTLDIPSNMPYGTAGIKLIDFISSIQKKFNLVIYPNKTKLYEFIIEPFTNWYKKGQIKNFNKYINLNQPISATPANNLAVQNLNFGDTLDGDYVSQQFAKAANHEFGKAYYVDTENFFSQGTFEVKTNLASTPLNYLQGTGITASLNNSASCQKFEINYGGSGPIGVSYVNYLDCNLNNKTQYMGGTTTTTQICAQSGSLQLSGSSISWTLLGACNNDTGSTPANSIKIYIPTLISSVNYAPVRTLPHIYFYNELKPCERWFIEARDVNNIGGKVVDYPQYAFPYFDNYSLTSGSNAPTTSSLSLLFNNEITPYGDIPTASLYSTYWSKYVELLYNPKTRLFDASAIIPLADYFKMALNDIVEWRGNYYHLRAINDYNLSNGECTIQLLGPVLKGIMQNVLPVDKCAFDFTIEAGPISTASLWDLTSCTSSVSYSAVSFNTTSSLQSGSVITWNGGTGCYSLVTSSALTASINGAIVYNLYNNCADCTGSIPPVEPCISCSQNIYLTYTGNDYYQYPTQSVCSTNSASFSLNWTTYERPNRITVYDATGQIATTGWKGDVNYAGPWGLSLHTATNGTLTGTFATGSGRYLLVEAGGGGGILNDDACSITLNCT